MIFLSILFSGCYKNHLYVQQESVDENYLASAKIGTPDPRISHPPIGTNLIIAWDFPKSLFKEALSLEVTVRLWDNSESKFYHGIDRKTDVMKFFFPHPKGEKAKSILTYKVDVLDSSGKVQETWEHHLWTKLITFDP